ncbi:hypothetical protein PI126_g19375 [Phytophthora idaei]|nr:hypothetical protein PI126_g19375 [Phytophthora idaei]
MEADKREIAMLPPVDPTGAQFTSSTTETERGKMLRGEITIGNRVMLAPNVQLYTATHPLGPKTRATGYERTKPITIEDDVWIGGSVVVLPGVTIGRGAVIGAGSVVTKNVPPMCMYAGNPAKFIKKIEEE